VFNSLLFINSSNLELTSSNDFLVISDNRDAKSAWFCFVIHNKNYCLPFFEIATSLLILILVCSNLMQNFYGE
jgi:hypothetical protein